MTIENDRIDKICKLRYGTEHNGNVEMVLLANRDLADYGALLPAGLSITLPEVAPPNAIRQVVKLWT